MRLAATCSHSLHPSIPAFCKSYVGVTTAIVHGIQGGDRTSGMLELEVTISQAYSLEKSRSCNSTAIVLIRIETG